MSGDDVKTFARTHEGGWFRAVDDAVRGKKCWRKEGQCSTGKMSQRNVVSLVRLDVRRQHLDGLRVNPLRAVKYRPRSLRPASTESMASIGASFRAEFGIFPRDAARALAVTKMREFDKRPSLLTAEPPRTHLDVRQPHDPHPQLSGEAHGVEQNEGGVSKPLQRRGAHARDA